MFVTVLLFVPMFVTTAAPAHTFHASLTRLEYDQQEELLEISIQVFSNDLENALSRRSGKRIRLDKSPDAANLSMSYLNDALNLKRSDGQNMTLSWVGMEPQADSVWIYVEVKQPGGIDCFEMRNCVFFDLFDDQINRVHVVNGNKKGDLVFKPGDGFKSIALSDPGVR
jgi:hypothetical protein